ncbi:MAG: DUF1778 domain-containing protein [Candidatus Acidiferrales bacterium]
MPRANTLKVPGKPERLEARIAPEQKRLIEKAARLRGTTVTEFVVSKVQEAAIQTVREFETLQLQDESREAFVAALLNPAEPNDAAKRAAARYKEQMGL